MPPPAASSLTSSHVSDVWKSRHRSDPPHLLFVIPGLCPHTSSGWATAEFDDSDFPSPQVCIQSFSESSLLTAPVASAAAFSSKVMCTDLRFSSSFFSPVHVTLSLRASGRKETFRRSLFQSNQEPSYAQSPHSLSWRPSLHSPLPSSVKVALNGSAKAGSTANPAACKFDSFPFARLLCTSSVAPLSDRRTFFPAPLRTFFFAGSSVPCSGTTPPRERKLLLLLCAVVVRPTAAADGSCSCSSGRSSREQRRFWYFRSSYFLGAVVTSFFIPSIIYWGTTLNRNVHTSMDQIIRYNKFNTSKVTFTTEMKQNRYGGKTVGVK